LAHQQLKQEEAQRLLEMLKYTLVDAVLFPEKGATLTFDVEGITKKDLFRIRIYRGKINRNKYNLSAQIEKNGILLLELHVNPGNKHINPDGTIIEGSHWHVFSEDFGRTMAFPAEHIESDKFIETTIQFLDEFKVIKKPEIQM
jgi:hypothetical protein